MLGYVWSVIKPLVMFSVLYVVFGRFFKLNAGFGYYPLYLLTGLVLWGFFADATTVAMPSVVNQGSLLRRLAFPRLLVPASATLTAALTFAVNLVVLAVFVAWNRLEPGLDWLLIVPLLAELYLFTFGVAVILATLFVRFRDTGQVWDLGAQVLFWSSPIIYPVGFLPPWAQPIAFLNPFVQVMQDVRGILIGEGVDTVTNVLGVAGHAAPLGMVALTLAAALLLFRREERFFAERV